MYQGLLGCPSTSALNNYVNNKLLLNCNITVDDINRAADIYGEAKPIIRGKMSREKEIVHSKSKTNLYFFQYQRDTKT